MESTKHDVKIQYKKIVIVTDSKKHPIRIVSLKVNEDDGKNENYSLAGIVTTTDFANFF